jgi:isopenicillin-N epimerase
MEHSYGRHWLARWLLDPRLAYLNHGTVGATPVAVIERARRLQDEIERQPAQFLLRELADHEASGEPPAPRMRLAARAVAQFVGCAAEQFVFVDNATAGCNAVLRSFAFRPGEEILVTNLGYGGVTRAAAYAARLRGCSLRQIDLPAPGAPAAQYVAAIAAGLSKQTRMLVVDHITSPTALVLPLAQIAAVCRQRGVVVLADGAHAPGAIELDIDALGVDFYVGNLHKWLWAPRACGFLWAAQQHAAQLSPTVTSWGFGNGLAAEFDLPGTRDPTPFLTAPYALELWQRWGGMRILQYNHELVTCGARQLAERWNVPFSTPAGMLGPMAYLPLPAALGSGPAAAVALQASLLAEDGIEVPLNADGAHLACRISAQIYNDETDFARLAVAVERRLAGRAVASVAPPNLRP